MGKSLVMWKHRLNRVLYCVGVFQHGLCSVFKFLFNSQAQQSYLISHFSQIFYITSFSSTYFSTLFSVFVLNGRLTDQADTTTERCCNKRNRGIYSADYKVQIGCGKRLQCECVNMLLFSIFQ